MSHDGAAFSQHSVLSPPLLAAIDSQHTFGSHHAVSVSPSHDQSVVPGTRSRASSSASLHNVASSHVHQTRQATGNKKSRRAQQAHSAHSRNGSRSGASSVSGRSAAHHNNYSATVTSDDQTRLNASLRNRSTSHLDEISSQSAAREHDPSSRGATAMTAPPSPLTSASAPLPFTMSPIAQAAAMADHLMPTDWNLDSPSPASPPSAPSRNASDYFDSALLAQLQSQSGSSHPELRANDGRTDPSPPLDTVFGRLSPHPTHAARSASQSEWAQHAAHMQQTAHLLGLQRLFASRSTPHLPDLDSSYLGHEFESPPPYAPQASAHETELERATDLGAVAHGLGANQNGLPSNPSSASTLHNGSDPPLPPPISIPFSSGPQSLSSPPSATPLARPPLRARSSSRGSRSGPPSPSASFYGRRGLTSLSPFPAGLEMTPSVAHVPSFSSNPASPRFAPDSDGDEDLATMLSFSSSRSKQRRDERRQTIASTDNLTRLESSSNAFSSSLPASSVQSQAVLSRRRRSGSAGSARQLLRPRTPIHSTQARASAAESSRDEASHTASRALTAPSGASASAVVADAAEEGFQRRLVDRPASRASRSDDQHADTSSTPISPTSDMSRRESPMSPDPARNLSPTNPSIDRVSATHKAEDSAVPKSSATAAEEDEETFPLVLKLLLHSLRVLAAVPGCIGTFWLARNAWILATEHGHLLSPGQIVITDNGANHFTSAHSPRLQPALLDAHRLGRRQPGSLDFAVACLWSMSTAYHALSFTTLLLRRWLLYYSILPSLIRLVALQAICWPLVRITVHVFGADQPLGAWVVIGTTTALSDVVSRWVTSNIADAPLDDELDEEEEDDDEADDVLGYLSDSRFVKSPPRQSAADRMLRADQHPWSSAGGQSLVGDSDWDPRSGDESDAAAASFFASERERRRRRRRGGQGTRFWRAVIGGPSFAATSRRRKNDDGTGMRTFVGDRSRQSGGTGTETEMEADSDWPGYTTDRTVLGGSGTPPSRSGSGPRWDQQGLRRRLPPHVNPAARVSTSPEDRTATETGMFGRRPVLPPFPFKASMYRQGHTRYVYRDGAWIRERTSSRRNFHWEVAVWRNVVPIAVLSYLSMWILIFDAMRLGG
ncbi:hypothetical protein PHSY_006516 [Pseudozyma hubeiensis SY62]|uniref:Myp1 protein n=1 Tax=Pseudozyma hubeiensis (strain SY62) TaxID=1305764 RepID=R9PC28_PSEHS|nr:hypothetical protein PHSY_006516 [Pseudozyma hubeiensis SY62]GAC98921.1 hypothetical protein PHSY_006516 [Pseudozyma hubeiensis SY62]